MPRHKERHVLGGMYVEPSKVLTLIHDGFEAAEKYDRADLRDLSESILSGAALILRHRVGYMYKELGDSIELLEAELGKLRKKALKCA